MVPNIVSYTVICTQNWHNSASIEPWFGKRLNLLRGLASPWGQALWGTWVRKYFASISDHSKGSLEFLLGLLLNWLMN